MESSTYLSAEDENSLKEFGELSFIDGDDGILPLDTTQTTYTEIQVVSLESYNDYCKTALAIKALALKALALKAVDSSLTPRKMRKYEACLNMKFDLDRDNVFLKWKELKQDMTSHCIQVPST
ncbi:hypothetical protein DPMN_002305 [Dreissena polymorpha]|uniref:Uncharacterized protein n=1 Tax=Dreissena polymorpha TaxID=45954 RepID=A0A9D4MNE6_DREPO|nr:hypothetical protein DPMN_002305 [Dreissena polymorpha]